MMPMFFCKNLLRLIGAEALIHGVHRQAETAMELIGKASREAGHLLFAAVHLQGQAHHTQRRLPLREQGRDGLPVGEVMVFVLQGGESAGGGGDGLADSDTDTLRSIVEGEDGLRLRHDLCRWIAG